MAGTCLAVRALDKNTSGSAGDKPEVVSCVPTTQNTSRWSAPAARPVMTSVGLTWTEGPADISAPSKKKNPEEEENKIKMFHINSSSTITTSVSHVWEITPTH